MPELPHDGFVSYKIEHPDRWKSRRKLDDNAIKRTDHPKVIMKDIPIVGQGETISEKTRMMNVLQYQPEGEEYFLTYAEATDGYKKFIGVHTMDVDAAKTLAVDEINKQHGTNHGIDLLTLKYLDVSDAQEINYQFGLQDRPGTQITVGYSGQVSW